MHVNFDLTRYCGVKGHMCAPGGGAWELGHMFHTAQSSLTLVSRYSELPPSMMISPASRRGTSLSTNASTAEPAFTSIMTRRGFFSLATISSREWAPTTLVPEGEREGGGREGGRREKREKKREKREGGRGGREGERKG